MKNDLDESFHLHRRWTGLRSSRYACERHRIPRKLIWVKDTVAERLPSGNAKYETWNIRQIRPCRGAWSVPQGWPPVTFYMRIEVAAHAVCIHHIQNWFTHPSLPVSARFQPHRTLPFDMGESAIHSFPSPKPYPYWASEPSSYIGLGLAT